MRILIVTPLLPPEAGGPSYYAVGLKEAFQAMGEQVDAAAFREVRKYPSGLRHLMFLYLVLWKARRADLMIILDTVSVALPASIAGWLLGRKVLVRTGGDFVWEHYVERTKEKIKLSEFYVRPRSLSRKERFLMWLQKHVVFKLATKVVFSTAWQRDIWRKQYCIPEAKTAVIENAYDVPKEKPMRPKDPKTFLWVGRDLVLKNVDVLTEAFAKVKEQYSEMGLKLLANAPREEVERELARARCLVLPSISEVSPNLVFEAIAHGVPVITTEDTGIRDVLEGTIIFCDTSNEDALTQAMLGYAEEAAYAIACEKVAHYAYERTYRDVAAVLRKHITSSPREQ